MTDHDNTERAALSLLRRGLATQSEVATLAGVSRQLVRYWANREGIDCARARHAMLLKAWQKARARRP